jgi:hypothetical protein
MGFCNSLVYLTLIAFYLIMENRLRKTASFHLISVGQKLRRNRGILYCENGGGAGIFAL